MKKLINTIFAIILLSGCTPDQGTDYPHYNIRLTAKPEIRHISVSGSWDIPVEDKTQSLVFYLHRQLDIDDMDINGSKSYKLTNEPSDIRYMPEAIKYTLTTDRPLKNRTVLNFRYSGKITEWPEWSASVIGEEWTELGLYLPWYPYNKRYLPFTYNVDVNAGPGYKTFVTGRESTKGNYTSYVSSGPTNDIIICASRDMKIISKNIDRYNFTLAHTTLSGLLIDSMTNDIVDILTLYNKWFPEGNNTVSLVESMRENGGAYARMGGMYLTGLDQKEYFDHRKPYIRYLGHEISHLWWHRADATSWEDWLNEGFAEYSALMVLRDLYGQDYFEERISVKRKESEDTDPVWHYDRNGEDAYTILYSKAPLLLNDLEKRIGKDAFIELLRTMTETKVSSTAEFLPVLENLQGKTVKEWFLSLLKEE